MHDQRVESRPPLGFENLADRLFAIGARCQAVDSLGRHGHQTARTQDIYPARDSRRIGQYRFRNVFAVHPCALYPGGRENQEDAPAQ